jgi:Rrf2 family protein
MLEIARLGDPEAPLSLAEVATWTGISRRYLEQLAIPLRRAGLLKGRSGRAGGYCLARDPAEISVGDIIAAAMGPVSLVKCVDTEGACARSNKCECRLMWALLTLGVRDVLDECSLANLGDPGWQRRMAAVVAARRARRGAGKRGRR